MNRLATSLVSVALLLASSSAIAQSKPKKPAVCVSYELIQGAKGKLGLCLDGKKPRVFTSFSEGTLTDPATGAVVRFLVGF